MSRKKGFEFTGGKHCEDCDEQILPARVRVFPKATRCTSCQSKRERRISAAVNEAGDDGIVVIRNSRR